MKKNKIAVTRRQVLKTGLCAGACMMLPWQVNREAFAAMLADGLSDPALQPKFVELAPNALDPGFLFKDLNERGRPAHKPNFSIKIRETVQQTGLINPRNGRKLNTKIWGYGNDTISWPGQTIQVRTTCTRSARSARSCSS